MLLNMNYLAYTLKSEDRKFLYDKQFKLAHLIDYERVDLVGEISMSWGSYLQLSK